MVQNSNGSTISYFCRNQREDPVEQCKMSSQTEELIYGPVVSLKSSCHESHTTLPDSVSSTYPRTTITYASRAALDKNAQNFTELDQFEAYQRTTCPGLITFCSQHEHEHCQNTCAKHGKPCGIPTVGITTEDIMTDDRICDDPRYFEGDTNVAQESC